MRISKPIFLFLLSVLTFSIYQISSHKEDMNRTVQRFELKEDEYGDIDELTTDSVSMIHSSTQKLEGLDRCYESEKCNFLSRDSKEYYFEVGKNLRSELLRLLNQVETAELVGDQISEIGRKYLKNDDGHVKEAALLLLSTQPPSKANLISIVENVIDYHNADLVEMGLLELQKYQYDDEKEMIVNALTRNLKSGALISKERISKGALSFINDDTVEIFEEVASDMPRGSLVRKNLEAAIERFHNEAQI